MSKTERISKVRTWNERKDRKFLPNTVGGARGMAIKLLNVGENQTAEQDFVMINHPVMAIILLISPTVRSNFLAFSIVVVMGIGVR